MKDKWKNRSKPNIDHIFNLMGNPYLSAFITGHLIIESVLVQLIDTKLKTPDAFDSFNLRFPQKTSLCHSLGLINEGMENFLNALNAYRNKFAHRLGHTISFTEAFEIVNLAASSGIDFSDDGIYQDKDFSEECYGIEGILQEVFSNTAMDLAFIIQENGGEFQFG